jgi:hypothetical protein
MSMIDFEVVAPYAIALLMSLGALCIFVWGVLAGAFAGTDEEAIRFYRTEVENDASHGHGGHARE